MLSSIFAQTHFPVEEPVAEPVAEAIPGYDEETRPQCVGGLPVAVEFFSDGPCRNVLRVDVCLAVGHAPSGWVALPLSLKIWTRFSTAGSPP